MIRAIIIFAGLVICCLWYGYAEVAERRGQMCAAIIGAFAFTALMYL